MFTTCGSSRQGLAPGAVDNGSGAAAAAHSDHPTWTFEDVLDKTSVLRTQVLTIAKALADAKACGECLCGVLGSGLCAACLHVCMSALRTPHFSGSESRWSMVRDGCPSWSKLTGFASAQGGSAVCTYLRTGTCSSGKCSCKSEQTGSSRLGRA